MSNPARYAGLSTLRSALLEIARAFSILALARSLDTATFGNDRCSKEQFRSGGDDVVCPTCTLAVTKIVVNLFWPRFDCEMYFFPYFSSTV